jgi:hypothetical protein
MGWATIPRLTNLSLVAAIGWFAATNSLANLLPRKAQAQAMVEQRIQDHASHKKK